jgi:hypothetical protein
MTRSFAKEFKVYAVKLVIEGGKAMLKLLGNSIFPQNSFING